MMRHDGDTRAGVAANWDRLPAHLKRALRGLAVQSQEELAVGRRWSLQWEESPFVLEAHVYRLDALSPLIPANFGGKHSKEIGDLLIEFDFKPDLLWQFKNVTLHLRALTEDLPEAPSFEERAQALRLAKAVQSFVEASVVSDLDAVTPRLELPSLEDTTLLLGTPLRLSWRAVNAAPEERSLDIWNEGFREVKVLDSELIAMPEHVGSVHLQLSLRNTRTLLRSPHTGLTFQCLRARGRLPAKVEARLMQDTRLEEGPRLRIRLDAERDSRERTDLFLLFLDAQRSIALQFGGPRFSNAPPGIVMRLQKALLLDGTLPPVPLTPAELHLESRHFPDIRGTITLPSQDWELESVLAASPSDSTWMEELRRRGFDFG